MKEVAVKILTPLGFLTSMSLNAICNRIYQNYILVN